MRKLLIVAALMIVMASLSAANNIGSEEVEVDLENSHVTAEIHVEELNRENFNYFMNYNVEQILVSEIDGEDANCFIVEDTSIVDTEIRCETDKEEDFNVYLEFVADTDWISDQNDDVSKFEYSQQIIQATENYTLRAILPPGAAVIDEDESIEPSIHPEHGDVHTTGQRIYVEWNENPGLELLSFHVLFQSMGDDHTPWRNLFITLILVLGLGFGAWYFYRNIGRGASIESLYEDLTDDEILVVDLLRENDGRMLQKDVVDYSEYSKAKVSGLVSKLVDKDIMTKEKEGRSNKLVLKEEYR